MGRILRAARKKKEMIYAVHTKGVPRERSQKPMRNPTVLDFLVPSLAYFIYAACPFPFLLVPPQLGEVGKARAPGLGEGSERGHGLLEAVPRKGRGEPGRVGILRARGDGRGAPEAFVRVRGACRGWVECCPHPWHLRYFRAVRTL